jgi:hypothetical protein
MQLKNQRLLRALLETRDNAKLFECLISGKNFTGKRTLKQHSLVHSDRRDFKCKICERRFKDGEEEI